LCKLWDNPHLLRKCLCGTKQEFKTKDLIVFKECVKQVQIIRSNLGSQFVEFSEDAINLCGVD
ncbi:hypothetical protein H0H87_001439, partial [Tephrocybe sp. NHM501043]